MSPHVVEETKVSKIIEKAADEGKSNKARTNAEELAF